MKPDMADRNESQYRLLIEAIPQIVWMTDAAGATHLLNQRGVEQLGWPEKAVHGWGWLDLLHPDDVERSRQVWEEAVRSTQSYRNEYRVRAADGTYRWYLSQAVPQRDSAGDVLHWVGTWTDIDDLKRIEAELRRTTTLLRAIADNSPDALFVKDLQGRYLVFNPAAARFAGKPVEEVLGQDDRALFDAADAARLMERDRHAIESGQVETAEEMLTLGGVSRIFLATKGPYRDEQGNIVGTIGISRDVTEHRRAEEALRLRDRAIQSVNQGILITDPTQADNPIIYVSPGFERATGYTSHEVLGRNCRFLQGRETDPDTVAVLRQAIVEQRSCVVEILNYRRDGSAFWNELTISPVRDEGGRLTHFIGVLADITLRRGLEEQLRQAQKMEAVGQLAGGIAHDFNNLLTIIGGYSEILLDSLPVGDLSREPIEEIRKAGNRSAALTRQLLAFSRKQLLTPKVLNLNDIVSDTEKMLRRVIGEDIQLSIALHPRLGRIKADPRQIEQVLMNLAVNARDAMPQGGRISIETKNVEIDENYTLLRPGTRPGRYALLTVTDTGVGMSEDDKVRAFEPFFTTKSAGKGTGLGLAVVHGIVKQSDGNIEIYSEPGIGTCFNVYLPIIDSTVAHESPADNGAPIPRGTETILLVEDEEPLRALTRRILQGDGYTVLEAAEGESALRLAERHRGPIDLLLTDVVMPGVGGRELAERLRMTRPDTQVLYVSGYTDDAVVRHGISQEQVNFLQKPFSTRVLMRKVRELLNKQNV